MAALIAFRLIWALSGAPQLGLERFYPSFKDLHLKGIATHPAISRLLLACIALSVIGATGTGIMMDNGRSLQPASLSSLSFSAESEESEGNEEGEDESGEVYEEAHELLANLAMAFVVMHVLYLLAFKRPLARFMLFANKSAK